VTVQPSAVEGARLVYLYMGSADVGKDLAFYHDQLGGEIVWHSRKSGNEVAAVRLGEGPLVLLADHRDAPSVRQIWAVDDLDRTLEGLKAAGWTDREKTVELPDGPCLLLSDPSGNEIGLLHVVRPGVMEGSGP
jgi:predicted enzyme related to lactoylglutathione lyase